MSFAYSDESLLSIGYKADGRSLLLIYLDYIEEVNIKDVNIKQPFHIRVALHLQFSFCYLILVTYICKNGYVADGLKLLN